MRNLRTKNGETSVGGKAILKCSNCLIRLTSEDLAVISIAKIIGRDNIEHDGKLPSLTEGFWEQNLVLPKIRVLMELYAMNLAVPHANQRESSLAIADRVVIGILRNLHKTSHVQKCFKVKDGECRMKIPRAPAENTSVVYDTCITKWYEWNGKRNDRTLFYLEPKRGYCDMFANVFNTHVSDIFQCNNNIVACVDGGSPMYLTAYHSKNCQKEDNEKVGKAVIKMISNMNKKIEEANAKRNSCDQQIHEVVDHTTLGLSAMIGSVFMSTSAHVCGAPMAAFLTRNQNRFWF
jgi:hypothetical protein